MRECGECNACCYRFPIRLLNKRPRKLCDYWQAGSRCTIYHDPERPDVCENFKCGWLQGMGEESDRPDLSGNIILLKGYGVPRDMVVRCEQHG